MRTHKAATARRCALSLALLVPVGVAVTCAQAHAEPGAKSKLAPRSALEVACHALYGGDEEVFVANPEVSPYEAPVQKASYAFDVRLVLEPQASPTRLFKFYVYRRYETEETILHEGIYVVPSCASRAPYGFTGLQSVHEPSIERELKYWCEARSPHAQKAEPKKAATSPRILPPVRTASVKRTRPSLPAHSANEKVRINFVGDVMLADGPGDTVAQGGDPLKAFDELFRSGDFTIGNLECPISTQGKEREGKPYAFQAHPRVIDVLKPRFYALALSNNHTGDYGPASFLETIEHLDKAGLKHFGGGKNLSEAHEPLWIEHGGLKIAILGYNEFMPRSFEAGPTWPGIAWSEDSQVVADIERARAQGADLVIPFLHWGWEYEEKPNGRQETFAHLLIDHGADMVIGGHPHVTQGVATYKGKPIVWSLGNFVFDGFKEGPGRWGWFLQITADRKGVESYRIVPAHLDGDGAPTPDLSPKSEITWSRGHLSRTSEPSGSHL